MPDGAPPSSYRDTMARGLYHVYHGHREDRAARYVPATPGTFPEGLGGRAFFSVFPYESVFDESTALLANPHMLTAPGRLLAIDLDPRADRAFDVRTRALNVHSWHVRAIAPHAVVRSDFAEISWLGLSNLANTTPVPSFPTAAGGRRMAMSYDAGRPVEIDPRELRPVSPIGKSTDYEAAVGSSFSPMIMTSGHPVYDPAFDAGAPALVFTNIVPRVLDFVRPSRTVRGDLYLMAWDGASTGPSRPVRVFDDGAPVIMEQASAHQICVTRRYILVFNATMVLNSAALAQPILDLTLRSARKRAPSLGLELDRLRRWLSETLRPPVPSSRCDLYIVRKDELCAAIARGGDRVDSVRVRLEGELTHALADWDDEGDAVTVYAQSNIGADPANQVEAGDVLMTGDVVRDEFRGLFTTSTDLNQVRKYVITVPTRQVVCREFPERGDPSTFKYGVNLLPPCQPLPYDVPGAPTPGGSIAAAMRRQDATYWIAGGYLPEIDVRRAYDIFRAHRDPSSRLVPEPVYRERLVSPDNTVQFFRLRPDLTLESAFSFPPGWFMGAPVFVPRGGSSSLLDGWLVGCTWGPDAPHVEIWIWDAARSLDLGPVCRLVPAPGEEGVCPGFPLHGGWIDRAGIDRYHPPALRDAMLDIPLYVKLAELAVMGGGFVSCAIRQMVQR